MFDVTCAITDMKVNFARLSWLANMIKPACLSIMQTPNFWNLTNFNFQHFQLFIQFFPEICESFTSDEVLIVNNSICKIGSSFYVDSANT